MDVMELYCIHSALLVPCRLELLPWVKMLLDAARLGACRVTAGMLGPSLRKAYF